MKRAMEVHAQHQSHFFLDKLPSLSIALEETLQTRIRNTVQNLEIYNMHG
jgi:hypothetical protein